MARLGNPVIGHAHTAELALFIRGRLPSRRADFICEHVMMCGICRAEVQEITELLWPSLSVWSKCWLRLFSPSSAPLRVLGFLSRGRMRRSVAH